MTDVWFWYHQTKSGGTTIRRFIERHADEGEFHYLAAPRTPTQPDADRVVQEAGTSARTRVVLGNKLYARHARHFADRNIREVVVFREPAARIASVYNYQRKLDRTSDDFEAWFRERRGLPQTQWRWALERFATEPGERHVVDEDTRGRLLERLGECHCVAVTSQLDDVSQPLLRAMGFAVSAAPDRRNTMVRQIDGPPPATTAWARELLGSSAPDDELYAFARARGDAYLKRVSP